MGKHLRETHQLHKLFKRNNVKVSYRSLANFKSVINGHNKDKLIKQEKCSPCNCREKTSSPWNGSYQNKNLFYSCKFSTPDIKPNNRISLALRNIHLKTDFINIIVISSKNESKRNSTELSNFIWRKKKEKIKVSLVWKDIPSSPASSKCILCLTEKYHISLQRICWKKAIDW